MKALLLGPAITVLVAIPMILGKVPPNDFYGFRTPKTLSSPEVWYPANRMCGVFLATAGVVSLIGLMAVFSGGAGDPKRTLPLVLATVLVPLAAAVGASFLYLRKL
jgi:uncharacterized membrane protein